MRSILCFFHIVIFSITATQNWGLDRFNSTRRIQNPPQPTFPASSLTSQTQPEFIPNIVVVQFAQEVIHKTLQTGLQEFDTKTSQLNIYSMERVYPFLDNIEPTPKIRENLLSLRRTYYVRYHSNTAPEQVADDLKITRGVIYAEPLIVHHLHTPVPKISPNDPEFRNQPELKLLGLPEAWDVVKGNEGSPKVIIAIVDTGAEWTHVDLLDNVWTNPNEIPDNGVDDDNNGFIDDVHGVNFANKNENDNDPFHLGNDHGTLVAGAAGAVTNNGIGVAGASWNAELMHINAYCRAWWGRAGICWGYEGILYAAANGAEIINASWGGSIHGNTRFYDESIDLATDMGALIVAAAGNDSRNLDLFNQYPADHPRVLSVGATEKDTRKLAKFSNYGKTVDVFAPGVKIRTTDLNNEYDYVNGTSFASPLVAGVAALVKTVQRDIPPDSLREFIRANSENMDDDNPNYKGELGRGFVNAFESTKASVSFPVIRLLNWQWTDNDGNLDNATGNEVTITAELMNYYRDADQLKIRLVGAEPYSFLDWLSTDIDIGFLSQNDPKQIKFIFRVGNDTPPNKPVQFFIQVQGEEFTDYIGEIHLFLNINLSVFSLHRDLSAFYASTNGDEWSDNGGWDPENVPQSPKDFAKWHGLYLRESYLIQIELPQNNLRGFISPELGDLSNLERLDLSNNRLRGKFAPELGRLTNLGELNLSNNEFTGQILPHFGNLSNIERLDLSNNRLTGKVAPELGRLANLGELNLSENELTGEILSHLGNLRTLKVLDLSNNFLSGEIPPQLGSMNYLEVLNLSNNGFHGEIPPQLGSMNDLFVLDLSNNRFYGQIPLELGHLWNLETLNLSDNEFIGVLPRSLMRLRNLRFFSHNGACAPSDEEFQRWVQSIEKYEGTTCPPLSSIQFIHNAMLPDPVNVSIGGIKLARDIEFKSATGYTPIRAGSYSALIQSQGTATTQSITVPTGFLYPNRSYAVFTLGNELTVASKVLETRLTSLVDNLVDVMLVHGSADLGTVRIQTIDLFADPRTAPPTRLLANNFKFNQVRPYFSIDSDYHRIEVISDGKKIEVFDLDLNGYHGKTLILNLSNTAKNLDIFSVDENGRVDISNTVTGIDIEDTETPIEFVLHGNYPNPFNLSTRFRFDLPKPAQVSMQIVDMIGREVLRVPAIDYGTGSDLEIELNTANLASGTYLYRMIMVNAENRYVKTGRMTLAK